MIVYTVRYCAGSIYSSCTAASLSGADRGSSCGCVMSVYEMLCVVVLYLMYCSCV